MNTRRKAMSYRETYVLAMFVHADINGEKIELPQELKSAATQLFSGGYLKRSGLGGFYSTQKGVSVIDGFSQFLGAMA